MKELKNVLIISYYWPPSGGVGVQRWLKMTKYFHQFDLKPIVYTPLNGEFPGYDANLEKEIHPTVTVLKNKIWEPYKLYKTFTNKKKDAPIYNAFIDEGKISWKQKLALFLRANLFIPDARIFWVKPSIKYLKTYITNNKIDLIISTGTPHSLHLIALGLVKHFPHLPWIADLRDPWSTIAMNEKLPITSWALNKHKALEKKVLTTADAVVTVSPYCAMDFEKISGREVYVINNGFDYDDFSSPANPLDQKFTITHAGSMIESRNTYALWQVLSEMVKQDIDFKENLVIQLIGEVDYKILNDIKEAGLADSLVHLKKLSHKDTLQLVRKSQVLLLALENLPDQHGILPGKMYEYLAAQRPILGYGSKESDAKKIIDEQKAGYLIEYDDLERTNSIVKNWFAQYKSHSLHVEPSDISKYSRFNLAKKYADLITSLINKS